MAAISSKINSTSFCRFWLALERFYDAGVPTDGRRVISSAPLTAERRNVAGCRTNWPTPATSLHTSVPQQRNTEQVMLSPAVRFLVETNHLNPSSITPTGPKSRLLKGDVLKYLAEVKVGRVPPVPTPEPPSSSSVGVARSSFSQALAPETSSTDSKPYVDTPVSSMRKTIAKRLTLSKTTIPYSYATTACTVDSLLLLRKQLMKEEGVKLTVNDFFIKAVAVTLERVPKSNATWSNDGIKLLPGVDISVAVATKGGLITPIIRGANVLKLQDISKQAQKLAAKARNGKLQPHEYQGGSFSISNLGMYGITEFTAIINPPQSAILAVGRAQLRPTISGDGGLVGVSRTVLVTLSCDARVIDYELACGWLETFRKIMESPAANLL